MKYIIAVDQSTSGTKVGLFNEQLERIRTLKKNHAQFYPAPEMVEHDAEEIWENAAGLLQQITEGIERKNILCVGIANQRETTVVWDRKTGIPVVKAVVWQDVRASYITEPLQQYTDEIFASSGLIPSPYYSAAKCAAILREHPELRARAENGELCFGTIDSFLLYRLTGGKKFATDISNAARTQLLDINTLLWNSRTASLFEIPQAMLPERILPSDSCFGEISTVPALEGVPVTAMMGDSNASFFGHGCVREGMVKTTYGTGSSLMMNIGSQPVLSKNGLSTSIGYGIGGTVSYVLEGNVTCSADTLIWLRDGMQLVRDMNELTVAETVESTDGVYLVPAFSGLGAPWFDEKARGILCGMNRGTTKAHIVRAALASIAHQNADVLEAMRKDTGCAVETLHADGGGSVNTLLMQMQSDYVPCTVKVQEESEMTLFGVAKMAALSAGLTGCKETESRISAVYIPKMSEEMRVVEREGWLNAVRRCK